MLAMPARAADEAPRSRMNDVLKARIAEDAKKAQASKPSPTTSSDKDKNDGAATDSSAPDPAKSKSPKNPAKSKSNAKTAPVTSTSEKSAAARQTPTVLPKVEVKKGRITELDQQLAKQEQDIARERKNLKTSEVDAALNDSKVAGPLAIFGGESTQFRKRVASERVELMEAEKDLLEAIARARTKAEKQELQKQLDQLKAFRRELEKSLR
jgi:hypothetical protein